MEDGKTHVSNVIIKHSEDPSKLSIKHISYVMTKHTQMLANYQVSISQCKLHVLIMGFIRPCFNYAHFVLLTLSEFHIRVNLHSL